MVVYLNSLVIDTILVCGQVAIGMYKSEVCLVLILCTCELDINWSLFLATSKIIEGIYWDWTGRILIP
jgi:hypothetical protein